MLGSVFHNNNNLKTSDMATGGTFMDYFRVKIIDVGLLKLDFSDIAVLCCVDMCGVKRCVLSCVSELKST